MDLENARQLIEQYGYLAVFLSTVIEGEFIVVAAAAIASMGLMQAHWVIAAAALGAWVGHLLLFAVGRWKGMQLIESVPVLRRHYPKANLVMDKYANWSVFIFQYLYGTRLVSAMLFGCSTIALGRFMALQVINCIIWAVLAYCVGHAAGMIASRLFEMIGLYGLLAVVMALAGIVLLVYRCYCHRHVAGILNESRELSVAQVDATQGRQIALDQLAYHIGLAGRSGKPLSLIMLRVRGGKRHEAGERLQVRLSLVAHELCRLLRLTDIPARFDADSFVIVAPNTDLAGANQAIARLQAELKREHVGSGSPFLFSGIAEWRPGMTSGKMLDACFASLKADEKAARADGAQPRFDLEGASR